MNLICVRVGVRGYRVSESIPTKSRAHADIFKGDYPLTTRIEIPHILCIVVIYFAQGLVIFSYGRR